MQCCFYSSQQRAGMLKIVPRYGRVPGVLFPARPVWPCPCRRLFDALDASCRRPRSPHSARKSACECESRCTNILAVYRGWLEKLIHVASNRKPIVISLSITFVVTAAPSPPLQASGRDSFVDGLLGAEAPCYIRRGGLRGCRRHDSLKEGWGVMPQSQMIQ